MSVAEFGARAGVSPATVVRACKRMGFGGFQRMREFLIRDQAVSSAVPTISENRHLVDVIFGRAVARIHGALGALDLHAFDAAAERIRDASRLLIVGNGASLPPAQSVALHFLVSGKACENPVDIVTQHISAKLLGPGDVCLAVSDSGMNSFTLRSARLARENGATVVAITSYGKSELATIADFALVAGAEFHSANDSEISGNIVQMLLLSALQVASLGGGEDRSTVRTEVLDEVRMMVDPGA